MNLVQAEKGKEQRSFARNIQHRRTDQTDRTFVRKKGRYTEEMSVLCFAGLFRSKELLNGRLRNIKFQGDHMQIHVRCSKTDLF